MNSANIVQTVRAVIARVLEDAAFIFSDELETAANPADAPWTAEGVSLKFSGERTGCFRLWADDGFANLLAENMLGLDVADEQAQEKKIDALKEMVNIIVGNSLTELFGTAAVFELGIPQRAETALRDADCGRSDAIQLQAEGNRIVCVVDLDIRGAIHESPIW
jgi:CheY-specific phosphatase CheX